jgi:hypothetical protein
MAKPPKDDTPKAKKTRKATRQDTLDVLNGIRDILQDMLTLTQGERAHRGCPPMDVDSIQDEMHRNTKAYIEEQSRKGNPPPCPLSPQ